MPRVIVLHGSYGCESGCCGHWVEIDGTQVGGFSFAHPSYTEKTPDSLRQWIIDVVTDAVGEDHAADIDFDHCIISLD